ncbi:unnamed protein product [Cyprideis torosa]|uniref:Vesicle transport protein USE1 n=1 Tax=Cyprideis torosa TaxID=163714 RepID=A0A7R8W313_9CRUS|nr:unnamed protein product [Cyprideis torosa]CAG0882435.1 unnamed protein product [Cyprideis torosa]
MKYVPPGSRAPSIGLRARRGGPPSATLQADREVNEVKEHSRHHERLTDEMLTLTKSLKEQSLVANQLVKKDIKVGVVSMIDFKLEDLRFVSLTQQNLLADKNQERLQVEANRLSEFKDRACKCWVYLVLICVCATFVAIPALNSDTKIESSLEQGHHGLYVRHTARQLLLSSNGSIYSSVSKAIPALNSDTKIESSLEQGHHGLYTGSDDEKAQQGSQPAAHFVAERAEEVRSDEIGDGGRQECCPVLPWRGVHRVHHPQRKTGLEHRNAHVRKRMFKVFLGTNEDLRPSPNARTARIKKGAVFPTNSYMNPPKGGPMRTPRASPPRAIPIAFPRSLSSGYRSANIPIPARSQGY